MHDDLMKDEKKKSKPKPKATSHRVSKGCCLCGTRKGVIRAGERVRMHDLHTDPVVAQRNFDDLLASGKIEAVYGPA